MYGAYKQLNRYREAKGRVRAVIYSRCSSDEQKKNGYTVKDQLDFGFVFAKENDLVVVGEYIDEGISATLEIRKRKDLARLIKDAKAGLFDVVVFKCIDRFFRNVAEYYECQKQLEKAGVTWISIEEPDLDPEDEDAAFKINIYLTMAEYEARKTSKRIKFNNKMRIKNKQVVTGTNNFHFPWMVAGEQRNRHLVRDMEKADRLYDLLEHFETHQSKRKTLTYYNMKYGETMSIKTIDSLLKDTLLYGEYKGEPDYVEPYISKERFDNIQDIIKRNARYSERANHVFLFSGILKCHRCGGVLVGNYHSRGNGKHNMSYRCNKYRQGRRCDNSHSTTEWMIEERLLDNLDKFITNEIIVVESLKEKPNNVVVDNTKKIESVKKEMSRLNMMFRKGRLEEDDYDKEYAVLEETLNELEKIEKPEERDLTALKELLETDYRTMYYALDRDHRKAFWRGIIKEFKLTPDKQIDADSIIFF